MSISTIPDANPSRRPRTIQVTSQPDCDWPRQRCLSGLDSLEAAAGLPEVSSKARGGHDKRIRTGNSFLAWYYLLRTFLTMAPVGQTYGALLIGGLLAFYLSGIVCTQCFLYARSFPDDRLRIKLMVLAVWFLDTLHSAFICVSIWHYLILGLSNIAIIQGIYWAVSVTISITGVTTFIIHCFFVHRVWTLSRRNIWLTGVIVILAFLRMLSAFGTVIQMSRLHTWARFHHTAGWSFTTGLVISACVDFLIAISLVYYLNRNRTGFERMDYIIDTIMLYTIENGMLTSVSVVASFICWITMPNNFIFLALHFIVSKMYANSLLATLNARNHIKNRSSQNRSGSRRTGNNIRLPTILKSGSFHRSRSTNEYPPQGSLQINVEKSVHCVTDADPKMVAVAINTVQPTLTFEDGREDVSPVRESRDEETSSGKRRSLA